MLLFSYTEKWNLKEGLNPNVMMPLLCMSTEMKRQEDGSTAGQDLTLEEDQIWEDTGAESSGTPQLSEGISSAGTEFLQTSAEMKDPKPANSWE